MLMQQRKNVRTLSHAASLGPRFPSRCPRGAHGMVRDESIFPGFCTHSWSAVFAPLLRHGPTTFARLPRPLGV